MLQADLCAWAMILANEACAFLPMKKSQNKSNWFARDRESGALLLWQSDVLGAYNGLTVTYSLFLSPSISASFHLGLPHEDNLLRAIVRLTEAVCEELWNALNPLVCYISNTCCTKKKSWYDPIVLGRHLMTIQFCRYSFLWVEMEDQCRGWEVHPSKPPPCSHIKVHHDDSCAVKSPMVEREQRE